MLAKRPVGRAAASRKYDILTALGALALSQTKSLQRLTLRFLTLITARYNWARDELAVGQREIARLWSCDERTVKREMARLRAMGWLELRRQGARGRVAEYRIDLARILEDTRPVWPAVGPDFAARLAPEESPPADDPRVVPFPGAAAPPPAAAGQGAWPLARALLHRQDPSTYGAWLHRLEEAGRAGGVLRLASPSRFHAAYVRAHLLSRIVAACQAVDDGIEAVELLCEAP